MEKFFDSVDANLVKKRDTFIKNIESDMHYTLNQRSNTLSFDWLDEIEKACPFIDNIVRHPKVTLVKDENVVEVERAKRITVDSVKDLAKHSNYITDVDGDDIRISKILDVRNEETFNIYENRFLYTLIIDLDRFIYQKESELNDFDLIDEKTLDYESVTTNDLEKIKIELKITSSLENKFDNGKIKTLVTKQRSRIEKVKSYISSWIRSEFYKELEKAHVQPINPPVKPTNVILKNPNFQVAVKLWEYIRNYGRDIEGISKVEMESDGNKVLLSYLDDAFLTSYFVLDSISKKKREEKLKICQYAILLLSEEVYKTMSLLLDSGINISEDELLSLLAKIVKTDSSNRLVGVEDIKKKFKSEIDEYLERAQKNL